MNPPTNNWTKRQKEDKPSYKHEPSYKLGEKHTGGKDMNPPTNNRNKT